MDSADRIELRTRVRALLSPTVGRCGADLVAVEFAESADGVALQLFIDAPGGVDIDLCSRVSHAISPELDVEDPLPFAYHLEVSSPGIERPLQRLEDFQRFRGYRARVRLTPGDGRKRFVGELAGIDENTVLVNDGDTVHRVPFDRVDRAKLDLSTEEYMQLADGLPALQGDSR